VCGALKSERIVAVQEGPSPFQSTVLLTCPQHGCRSIRRWRLRVWIAVLVLFAALSASAEQLAGDTPVDWNYTARSWQAQNGLPGETVQAFAQTPDGFLWVGTSEGLFRFDGANFKLFSHENTPALRENSVFCLLASRNGHLWIGTDGGGLVEMHDAVFKTYAASDGLTDGFVRALFEDRAGALWVATDSGLFRVKTGRVTRIDNQTEMPANAFHGLFEDHGGRIWAGAGQLYSLYNEHPEAYSLGGVDNQHRVKSIVETVDGSIWVGTVSGLYRLLPGADRFAHVPGIWGTVRTLREVAGGELWAGTIGQGIFRIRYQAPRVKVTRLTAPSPLVSNTVLSIFADNAGNLWIGTQVGMIRLSRTPVSVLLLPTAADSDFGTISLDADGSLWAASNQLVHIVGDRAVPVHLPQLGNAHVRNVLRTRDGTLWFGTDGSGLFKTSSGHVTHITTRQGLVNNFVRGMMEDRDGSLWIATDAGLTHTDGKQFHNFAMNNGLSHFSMRCLLQDRSGDIWAGTERGVTHLRNGKPIRDPAIDALKEEKVWAEHEDSDGGLWFGTRTNGLYRLRNGVLTHYTTADGLAGNSILSILEDNSRHLWMSGPQGVMWLNRDELDAEAQDPAQTISMRFFRANNTDETPVRFYGGTQPAGILTRAGEPCFPTSQGLWKIRSPEFNPAVLSNLSISTLSVDGRVVPQTSSLTLTAGQSRLEIGFQPVMLSSQSDLQFRYRMTGFDQDWTRSSADHRSATYTNLPAGEYTFLVEAWRMDHPEHVVRASILLVKRPYFYKTPWFVALCLLFAGLIAFTAYQVRMKQIHGQFAAVLAERSRLAREMHDTLIQGCAGVSAMLEAVRSCEADDRESRTHLVEYANTQIRAMMDEARQAVWDLRRDEMASSDLASCIQQMADRLSNEYSVSLTCSTNGEPFPLGHQQTHELLMVAREAFFNAILHGHPNTISAEMRFSTQALQLFIQDDGRGFDPNAGRTESGHYGLQGMRERVQRLGGTLVIESAPQRGTRVCATIPCGA
jgi:ligand-binding sensor domain-containing protein/signal transduction histidine kinase